MHKYFEKQRSIFEKRQKSDFFFFLLRGQEKKGRTIPSFKGIRQLEIFKWAKGGVEKSHERSLFSLGYIRGGDVKLLEGIYLRWNS